MTNQIHFANGDQVLLNGPIEKHHNTSGFDIPIGTVGFISEHAHNPLVRVEFQIRPNNNFKLSHSVLVWVKKENLELVDF